MAFAILHLEIQVVYVLHDSETNNTCKYYADFYSPI